MVSTVAIFLSFQYKCFFKLFSTPCPCQMCKVLMKCNDLILRCLLFLIVFFFFSFIAVFRALPGKYVQVAFANKHVGAQDIWTFRLWSLGPETHIIKNRRQNHCPLKFLPFSFQAHFFSLLPSQLPASFKVIHGLDSNSGRPDNVWI